jgi:hypothetical protein
MTYALLVFTCIAVEAAVATYAFRRMELPARQKAGLGIAIALSIALKILFAAARHNYDIESYQVVAGLVQQGKSVYANTDRYNYAPPWALVVAGLQYLSHAMFRHPEGFHMAVAGFLGITDAALAVLICSAYSYGAAMFFLCAPVSSLLAGGHSQFESFALLPALAAWLLIRDGPASRAKTFSSAVLVGLSLAIKHILFLFPVWLLFWPRLGSVRRRLAYLGLAYTVFASTFLLPWMDPASRAGILKNVFGYRSVSTLSITHLATAGLHLPLTPIWIAAMALIGWALRRHREELLPMYLLSMFALSPALSDQYLALPMLACAILFRDWAAWAFVATGTLALISSRNNVLETASDVLYTTFLPATQICSGALALMRWRAPKPGAVLPRTAGPASMRATGLALASVAAVRLLMWLKP